MAILDDTSLQSTDDFRIVNPAGRRRIACAVHDVDGTHSHIRQWPPVMSACLDYAMTCGLDEGFDDPARVNALVEQVGARERPETDRFCTESAGLSAITQMEWAIRRGVQAGNVPAGAGLELTEPEQAGNAEIIRRIWDGRERYDDLAQPAALERFIQDRAPRLFRLYEEVLNRASRDANLEDAKQSPARWRVTGSLRFLEHLRSVGVTNYFVTGAVFVPGGGMAEEIETLGIDIGPGKLVEACRGSDWDRKMPKDEVMDTLFGELGLDPGQALVVGDGRKEMQAGVDMGCVTMSRLDAGATRLRELHAELGVNYIVPDYTSPVLGELIGRQ